MQEQKKIIEEIAEAGKNCVLVGRNADVLLKNYHPLNIFVCADMDAKVKRCIERAEDGENLTKKQIKRMIKRIDRNRARTRFLIAEGEWGDRGSYDLIVNTTKWDIKELAKPVASFAKTWFENKDKE